MILPIKNRCPWCKGDPLYEQYHDEEWGVPLYDDTRLFEFLILEGAQAGLSWLTILRKRDNYRLALDNFNPAKIARYHDRKCQKLLTNEGIIRNRRKIHSAVNNARCFLDVLETHDSFSTYLWQFVDYQPVLNHRRRLSAIPAKTRRADLMSRDLKKRGFSFVGPTICYAFMQATGMVNDHLVSCYRHQECAAKAKP